MWSTMYRIISTCFANIIPKSQEIISEMRKKRIYRLIFGKTRDILKFKQLKVKQMKQGAMSMLIQFNFKNYKSFKDEAILDLTATKQQEHVERVVNVGGEKVLTAAAIYGANASGKSTIYNAFDYMTNYVLYSFKFDDDLKQENDSSNRLKVTPYIFDELSKKEDSQFEVYFTHPDDEKEREFNYGFCINETVITEEWLNVKAKTAKDFKRVFYRGGIEDELDLSGLSKNEQNMLSQSLGQSVLIASLGAKLKIKICMLVRHWFALNETADFGDVISNLFLSHTLPNGFADDKSIQKEVVKYLASFDDSIEDFRIEEIPKAFEDDYDDHVKVFAKHKNSENDIPLENESAGTLKMFVLYQILCDVFEKGGVLFVDELNAKLHPLLVRGIILLFINPEINKKHAQLLFTIHDAWQISDNTLRRDEIWFVEKRNGESFLYSLADFVDEDSKKIRKDSNYLKNYLLGKYGAIPEMQPINLSVEGINNEE